MPQGKTLLVTGASGFTGCHLISAAQAQGYHCVALCSHPEETVPGAEQRVIANLLDRSALEAAVLQANASHVIHLAAISFVAHECTSELYQVNLVGTLNLLDALRSAGSVPDKVILASSANIYGNTGSLPITEETPVQPVNHYGVSKYAMEQAAALYTELPIVTVRPFNYTGVGQSSNFLIPKIVNAFRSGKQTLELGNLDVARDFSDVRDVVHAYLRLLEAPIQHRVYNTCSGKATSLMEIVNILESLAGYDIAVSTNPAFVRSDEIKVLYGSPARLESCIGQFQQFPLAETLAWMLSNGNGSP